jgi:translation initiation factor 2 subunit 2
MNRPGEHFQQYCMAELGTTGTLDGNNRLVMRGRFDPRKLESIQKSYIGTYLYII